MRSSLFCKGGALLQWSKLPTWKVGDCGFEPHSGLQVSKKENVSSLPTRKYSILLGSLRDREVACPTRDRRCSNFESCVLRAVPSHSSHYPQEALPAQFSLYVHKSGLNLIHFFRFPILYVTISWFILINIFNINSVNKRFFLSTFSTFFSDFSGDNLFLIPSNPPQPPVPISNGASLSGHMHDCMFLRQNCCIMQAYMMSCVHDRYGSIYMAMHSWWDAIHPFQ